jgi:anionic cell wall polymer biosynthesis LytR-Cps2A-Psr (LCP) family protein
VIDAIGPIQACPPERIFDDKYRRELRLHDSGIQGRPPDLIDAAAAHARVRHNDGDGDIGRACRQQE